MAISKFDKNAALEDFSEGFDKFLLRSRIKAVDVAEKFALTDSAVSAWKKGKSFPDFQALCKLFEMGMTIPEAFGRKLGTTILKASKSEIIASYLDDLIEKSELEFERNRRACAEALAQVKYFEDAQDKDEEETTKKKIAAMAKLNLAKDDMIKTTEKISLFNSLKSDLK